jgi:hypothetical protein
MEFEFSFITGAAVGIELVEMEKTYLVIDLLVLRILISKHTED